VRPSIIDVRPLDDYKLILTFGNGEKKIYDMAYWLDKPMFQELKNIDLFRTVKVVGLSISWLHGQDLCPDELYEDSELIQ
jgi:hypothetical protein